MKAMIYQGPGRRSWENTPDPIVRIDAVTICGTDLPILRGDVPEMPPGRILGHLIDGTQAEYVRVPFADTSLYPVPESVPDRAALMLADILPTAYDVGVRNGAVRPGDTADLGVRHARLPAAGDGGGLPDVRRRRVHRRSQDRRVP